MSDTKINILVSFAYINDQMAQLLQNAVKKICLVLDSGAFTNFNTDKKITLEMYCDFLKNTNIKPWRYFTFDVIGDTQKTKKNYYKMLERGFSPIPIFTRGENIKQIDEYYQTSDVVGLGGLVYKNKNKNWLKFVMNYVKERKVHWLGFTQNNFLKFYKPYMADSSMWNIGSKFGTCPVYIPEKGKMVLISRKNIKEDLNNYLVLKNLKKNGINPLEFFKEKSWYGSDTLVRRLGALSMVSFSIDCEKKINTKLFSVVCNKREAQLILNSV